MVASVADSSVRKITAVENRKKKASFCTLSSSSLVQSNLVCNHTYTIYLQCGRTDILGEISALGIGATCGCFGMGEEHKTRRVIPICDFNAESFFFGFVFFQKEISMNILDMSLNWQCSARNIPISESCSSYSPKMQVFWTKRY